VSGVRIFDLYCEEANMPQNTPNSGASQSAQGGAADKAAEDAAAKQHAGASAAGQGSTAGALTHQHSPPVITATSSGPQQSYPPPPQPVPPQRPVLSATVEECVGEVRVRAFVYPCSDGDGPFQPLYQPLANQEITLIGQDVVFSDCAATDNDGVLVLRNVPGNHDYTLSFATPARHTLNEAVFKPGDSFRLDQFERKTIELGFRPDAATIRGIAFLDETSTGLLDGQPVITQAQIDFSQGGSTIGCVSTDDQGLWEVPISCPNQLVRVEPHVALVDDSRALRPLVSELFIMPEPGRTFDLAIPYTLGLAEIRVNAQQIRPVNGQPQRVPLPNVTFSLFKGAVATGTPFRQATTRGSVPVVFGDLQAGMYVLAASAPNQTPPLEAVQPRNGVLSLFLPAGQTMILTDQFEFRTCAGSIRGTVLDSTCGDGIAGVSIFLERVDHQGIPLQRATGSSGEFFFEDLQPGEYIVSLAQEQFTLADGSKWELPPGGLLEQRVQVNGSLGTHVSSFRLIPEEHLLVVHLETPDQQPVRFGVVDVLDERGNPITTITADERGIATYNTGVAGTFMVEPHLTKAGQTRTRIPVTVNSTQHVTLTVPGITGGTGSSGVLPGFGSSSSGSNGHNGEIKEAVIDLAAYPVLTEASSGGATPSTSSGGGASSAPLGQIVDNALRDVLAVRAKASDPKGFLAALNQAFTCTETDGRSTCVWTPRSYAVQADLGAITGAQASIYTRAKALIDQSIPLLEGLYPLRADADLQDVDAERAIVHSNMLELINELGVQGGPIVARVDSIFNTLLGLNDFVPNDIEELQDSQLKSMRDEFGFDRDLVNTIEEEQNLTNFIIIVDNIASLRQSWINQRPFFDRSGSVEPFFGTQMVLLSRSLGVISESVHEVYYAMDSVFLDDAERHTVELVFTDPATRLFISELLGWTDRFASEEAPRLIQDGGKSGVISLRPTLEQLAQLARGALLVPKGQQNPAGLPAGFRTARVQRALEELADHLNDALDLAEDINRDDDIDIGRLIGAVQSPQGITDLANQLTDVATRLRQLQPTDAAQLSRQLQQRSLATARPRGQRIRGR
jgi:hypothetical protein